MATNPGPSAALVVLLAVRGGSHAATGRWAGDEIAIVSQGPTDSGGEDDAEDDMEDEYSNYLDISYLIIDVLQEQHMRQTFEGAKSKTWAVYNLTLKEYFCPGVLGCAPTLAEIAYAHGPAMALHLLAASFEGEPGEGDPCSDHEFVGSWAGDRLAIVGDGATPYDLWPGVWKGQQPLDFTNYEDISWDVRAMLEAEVECLEEDYGDCTLKAPLQEPAFPALAATGSCAPPLLRPLSEDPAPFSLAYPVAWSSLPAEILARVSGFADDPEDLASLRLVSKAWRSAVSVSVTHLRPTRQLWDAALNELRTTFPNLTSLDISGCARVTDAACAAFGKCASLSALDIGATGNIAGHCLLALHGLTSLKLNGARKISVLPRNLKHLERLEIRELDLVDETMDALASSAFAPYLTSLSFSRPAFGDAGKTALCESMTNLSELEVSKCAGLTDDWIHDFGALQQLRSLTVSGCNNVTDQGLQLLPDAMPNLTSLDVNSCIRITNEGVEHLKRLPALESLSLRYCYELTDQALEHLLCMPSLRALNLQSCKNISESGIKALCKAFPDNVEVQYGMLEEDERKDWFPLVY